MNTHTLKVALKARGWSASELARRVGVSRQAVSLWLKRPEATLRSNHLLRAARVLGLSVESLAEPMPVFGEGDEGEREALRAALLWDRLYPDLDDLAIAINRWEPQAVARLVQVRGLYVAERLLGKAVWKRFDDYRRHIHPARRGLLEELVKWHRRPTPI